MDKKIIGIDLGGTTAKFAILTPEGEIQQKWSIDTNILDDGKHIVPEIIESINHRLNLYNMKAEDFIGIGMGTPGSVDSEAGTVIGAYNLNWTEVQFVKKLIEAGTGIKFAIDNDANVAALGERWKVLEKTIQTLYSLPRNRCWRRYRCWRKFDSRRERSWRRNRTYHCGS